MRLELSNQLLRTRLFSFPDLPTPLPPPHTPPTASSTASPTNSDEFWYSRNDVLMVLTFLMLCVGFPPCSLVSGLGLDLLHFSCVLLT